MDPARIAPALASLVRPIGDCRPHPQNARNGDTDAIVASLMEYGQVAPVVVQASTGYIVKGNHVTASALELGWETLAQTWVDMDDTMALRFLVDDNRTSDLGRYDDPQLAEILKQLDSQSALPVTITDGYLEALLQSVDRALHDDLDLGGAGDQTKGLGSPVISYAIVFDDTDQQNAWYDLMRWMRHAYHDCETVGDRITALVHDLKRRGVMVAD